ncbi:Cysteine desulfurase [hydrothermal vent metagenome]|uniref:cysteine desulfurase n=1 Tax=hydrothermal vent metagenome TaxID=652676 RepID=A0A3B1C8R9_9ZZZZ
MKPPIYLDNASSSFPKPKSVAKAVSDAINLVGANPGRSSHVLGLKASRIVFETREAAALLLKLNSPERIIFTKNATEGINLALKGLLGPGDEVAISSLEHNAVIRPLTVLQDRGVKIVRAPCDANGLPDPGAVPDVKMLVTVGASNVTAALADIKRLGKACKEKNVLLMVDASQTAGCVPFDTSNIDVLACSGHKGLLGPQGTGLVWFAPHVRPETMIEGGSGSDSQSAFMPAYWPDRHEAGTLNTPGLAGLKAALKYLERRTIKAVRQSEVELCRIILDRLRDDARIVVYPPRGAARRAGLVSFNAKGVDPAQLGDRLDRLGIAVRVGLHCAPEAHRFLGTFPDGTVRVSPGVMTRKADIKKFFKALDKALRE